MSTTPSRTKAVVRTAGSASLALAAFAAVATAGGHPSAAVEPSAVAATIAAAHPVTATHPVGTPHTVAAHLPAAAAVPAPMPAPAPPPLPIPAPAPPPPPPPPPAPSYSDNLDGWIHQALDIVHGRGIPASYDGVYRNILRESSGNPQAINLYDSNAAAGIPSKGLLQVIDPTFQAYHVPGTSWNIYDPVANIAAACNYAAARYGSMDNVDSAY